ncbi:hypothetical protein DYB32_000009 [Aphanomyces invadans]|uniref:Uncharacterized protein n=1 Tax=Aphanomyces invadans TaxID=157072 RepID=A0A418BBB8_9STRA|nr:hypothetical protein DYB32_000009 [Aphanomyces invadans]
MLRQAVETHGERNWKSIAEIVPGRNHTQCLQRWTKVLAPGLIKGHWRPDEDDVLRQLVAEGRKNWGQVAARIPGRTSKQCRERWYNHLDPNIVRGYVSVITGRTNIIQQCAPGITRRKKIKSSLKLNSALGIDGPLSPPCCQVVPKMPSKSAGNRFAGRSLGAMAYIHFSQANYTISGRRNRKAQADKDAHDATAMGSGTPGYHMGHQGYPRPLQQHHHLPGMDDRMQPPSFQSHGHVPMHQQPHQSYHPHMAPPTPQSASAEYQPTDLYNQSYQPVQHPHPQLSSHLHQQQPQMHHQHQPPQMHHQHQPPQMHHPQQPQQHMPGGSPTPPSFQVSNFNPATAFLQKMNGSHQQFAPAQQQQQQQPSSEYDSYYNNAGPYGRQNTSAGYQPTPYPPPQQPPQHDGVYHQNLDQHPPPASSMKTEPNVPPSSSFQMRPNGTATPAACGGPPPMAPYASSSPRHSLVSSFVQSLGTPMHTGDYTRPAAPALNFAASFAQSQAPKLQQPPSVVPINNIAASFANRAAAVSVPSDANQGDPNNKRPRLPVNMDAARAAAARRMRQGDNHADFIPQPPLSDQSTTGAAPLGEIPRISVSDINLSELGPIEEMWRVSSDMNRLSL